MDDFFIRALLGGIGIAITAGPLGCFVVWKRMAYFGDAISHCALLGVILGFVLNINMMVGILCVAALFSVLLIMLQKQRTLTSDTTLGIMAHSGIAVGLVSISLISTIRVDMMSYLFGDILAIDNQDILIIYAGMAVVLLWLMLLWRPLLLTTLHEDLARVQGIRVTLVQLQFMLLIAILVSLSIKLVGIVLITALLIIPAASARRFSSTPEQMAVITVFISVIAVISGLYASLEWDTPSGPSIVVAALCIFLMTCLRGSTLLFRKG